MENLYSFVGPFTHEWNNPPAAFNPFYDERAEKWRTLAVYDAYLSGVYDKPQHERPALIAAFYELRKSKGYVSKLELEKAKQFLYNI